MKEEGARNFLSMSPAASFFLDILHSGQRGTRPMKILRLGAFPGDAFMSA